MVGETIFFSGKILIIGGGIANFTNVSATFKVCIKPVQSFRETSKCNVTVKNFSTHGAPRSSQELFQKCLCVPILNWNLEMLVFKERGKPEYPEKNSRSRVENQQQTQPT